MSVRTDNEVRNQKVILGLTTTALMLCYLFYFLRIISRKLLKTPLWIDDWFMLFALCVCSAMSTLNYVGVAYGSGVHRSHLEASQYRSFQINLYVGMMAWALGVAVVKIGILLFYWRVFVVREFRRRVLLVGAIVLVSSTAIFLSFMVQCNPIPRFWGDTEDGYCINQMAFYFSAGSLNIASDILVLSLPIRRVWKLNAPLSQRIALLFLFSLGAFVCVTSIVRLTAINKINPEDFSYTNVSAGLWSTAEVQIGFICANLPHTQHLLVRCFQRWRPRISTWQSGRDRPSRSDYSNSSNARTRSHRDAAGFHNLGSESKSTAKMKAAGPVAGMDIERGYTGREEASIGTYDSDHELISMVPPCEGSVGRVEVRTEMRQEVQRIASPRAFVGRGRKWGSDTVSTEISAKGP